MNVEYFLSEIGRKKMLLQSECEVWQLLECCLLHFGFVRSVRKSLLVYSNLIVVSHSRGSCVLNGLGALAPSFDKLTCKFEGVAVGLDDFTANRKSNLLRLQLFSFSSIRGCRRIGIQFLFDRFFNNGFKLFDFLTNFMLGRLLVKARQHSF